MTFRLLPVAVLMACGGGGGAASTADAGATADAQVLPPAVGRFPDGFQWGTAIAPYQVEKGLTATDWHQWESLCRDCTGEHADDGPDFLAHYDADFALARAMGTNSIRLGIEWARVFPTRASFPASPDPTALATYHAVLASARAHGLRPMVTLHHFSTPSWIDDLTSSAEKRGWEVAGTADLFAEWARFCAAEFGGEVDWWITINEPLAYVSAGWLGGVFPPGKLGAIPQGLEVAATMIRAHVLAYDAIHAADRVDADGDGTEAWVSISTHNRVFVPLSPAVKEATDTLQYVNNRLFLDAVHLGDADWNFDGDLDDPGDRKHDPSLAGHLDYIGLNYYGVSVVIGSSPGLTPFAVPAMNDLLHYGVGEAVTDFGTMVYSEGFRVVLDEIRHYGLPIIVTENGLADADDDQRPRFLTEHLYALAKAIDDGLDIRGYYHWSLLDNFEWAAGFCPRFGLIHVDLANPARPRTTGAGADVYKEIITAGTVPVDLFRRYPRYPEPGLTCPRTGL